MRVSVSGSMRLMAKRVCLIPGCPTLTTTGRCDEHAKPNPYGYAHQKMRAQWAPKVAQGTVICWRCDNPIGRHESWDLGHIDGDPNAYAGPEHVACNRATASRY